MKHFQRVILDNIYYLQASDRETLMVSTSGEVDIYKLPLSHFEKIIETNHLFIKIHRKYIVNRSLIKKIESKAVIMQDGRIFPKSTGLSIKNN